MVALALLAAHPASAQIRLHLTGTASGTHASASPGGGPVTQVRLEQVMARATATSGNGVWRAWASGNLEGLTMPNGALSLGAFGEGFVDRRHPHTYVHELGGSVVVPVGGARASLSAGRGFVAFGTDDPMHQPPLAYPVNHHWSQILERLVVIGGVAAGPVLVEGTLFNGDEPEYPSQWPSFNRLGDSWAARLSVVPATALELQLSYANVHSPEHRGGAGPDATKWSVSVGRMAAVRTHAEWALTDEAGRRFTTVLAMGEWAVGAHRPYLRLERTDRPEEERTFDQFRSVRPHLDDHVIGITRWSIVTAGYGLRLRAGGMIVEPIAEGAVARVTETTGGLFDPALLYGRTTMVSLTVAVRLHWGMAGTMGRYGVRDAAAPEVHHH
jgi:hypothetical protein